MKTRYCLLIQDCNEEELQHANNAALDTQVGKEHLKMFWNETHMNTIYTCINHFGSAQRSAAAAAQPQVAWGILGCHQRKRIPAATGCVCRSQIVTGDHVGIIFARYIYIYVCICIYICIYIYMHIVSYCPKHLNSLDDMKQS
jgi:hypothetical protein